MKKSLFLAVLVCCGLSLNTEAQTWSLKPSPTTNNLYGVACRDSNTWIAVGDVGTIIRSTNGGNTWTSVSSPVADALRAVSFNGDIGVAVGIGGIVLRTKDGGLNWVSETKPTTKPLYSVSMSPQMAVIGGEEGTILVSTDNGVNWNPHTAGTAAILFGMSVLGEVGIGSGGQGDIILSNQLGAAWSLTVIGTLNTFFYGISFATNKIGWTVGTSSTLGSIIARSNSAGFTWASQTSPVTDILFGVSAIDTSKVTAVGGNGSIINTVNGGKVWTAQSSGITETLNAVSFVKPNFGIAVGNGGKILKTTNIVSGVADISMNKNNNFIYPNPNNGTFFIKSEAIISNIEIVNMIGEIIFSKQINADHFEIDLGDQPRGIYYYKLKSNHSVLNTGKIIIER